MLPLRQSLQPPPGELHAQNNVGEQRRAGKEEQGEPKKDCSRLRFLKHIYNVRKNSQHWKEPITYWTSNSHIGKSLDPSLPSLG